MQSLQYCVHFEEPVWGSPSQRVRKPSANDGFADVWYVLLFAGTCPLLLGGAQPSRQAQWKWSPLPDTHMRLALAPDARLVRVNNYLSCWRCRVCMC